MNDLGFYVMLGFVFFKAICFVLLFVFSRRAFVYSVDLFCRLDRYGRLSSNSMNTDEQWEF